ncbi:MAG: MgtC/SapB family protein [Chloroflexi bacterium]|nr:MgtC/SapB family protein [Chloroflexota bacterium]
MPPEFEFIPRLLIAAALTAVIGVERQLSDEVAGLRTHVLVGIGACLFSMMAAFGLIGAPNLVIAAQIVSGIGFLGAGAILRSGFGVRGLATAASLWVAAAVGMAAGLDHWALAAAAALLAVGTLTAAQRFESAVLFRRRAQLIEVTARGDASADRSALVQSLAGSGARIRDLRFEITNSSRSIDIVFELPSGMDPADSIAAIGRLVTVEKAVWTI